MMILRVYILFILSALFSTAANRTLQVVPERWDNYIVEFSDEGSLKDLFDSGLRPYRFPALEKTSVEVGRKRISFVIERGLNTPELPMEYLNAEVLSSGKLSYVRARSIKLELEEAKKLMNDFSHLVEFSSKEMNEYLGEVEKEPLTSNISGSPKKFGFTIERVNGPRYRVYFVRTFDKSRPLAIRYYISWSSLRKPRERIQFYNVPIPPPEGYEDANMTAPDEFGPMSSYEVVKLDKNGAPSKSRPHDKKVPIKGRDYTPDIPKPKKKRVDLTPKVSPVSEPSNSWHLWVLASLFLGVLLYLIKINRR